MGTKRKLVSIIIPVYNVESYLDDCLKSVLNQTYDNIEVIAVDDGSVDDSPLILKEYASKYSRLRVYLQDVNQGQGTARNLGLEKAKGDYILFVDSDDYIETNTVKCLVDVIEETNVDFIRFNATSFSSEGELIKEDSYRFTQYLKEKRIYTKKDFKDIYLSFMPSPVLYMFTKDLLSKYEIIFPSGIIHEDEVFSALLFLYARSCVYINKDFYRRRYRAGSTMTDKTEEQVERSFSSYIKIIEYYERLLMNDHLTENQKFFLKYRINSIYRPLEQQAKNGRKKEALDKVSRNYVYYSASYKNYIRFLKAMLIFKNKLN